MNEQKLFHIYIQPKDLADAPNSAVYDFRIAAESPVMALAKVMDLPNINFMYNESKDAILIKYEGYVY